VGLHLTEAEYSALKLRGTEKPKTPAETPTEPQRRSKYGNRKTEQDGERFDSQHEAKAHAELLLRVLAGELRAVARQVPFRLPGGVIYKADFVLLNNDGTYTVMDAKSEATARDKVYRLKKRQMKKCLGLEITEV
jgi:hypothetical protein